VLSFVASPTGVSESLISFEKEEPCSFMDHYSAIPELITDIITGVFNGSIAVMALSWVVVLVSVCSTCWCVCHFCDEEEG